MDADASSLAALKLLDALLASVLLLSLASFAADALSSAAFELDSLASFAADALLLADSDACDIACDWRSNSS